MKNSNAALLRLLKQHREFYPLIIIYSIGIGVLTLATPISVQSLVNSFSFGPFFQPLFILSLILCGLLCVLGLLKSLQYLVVEYLQRRLYAKITASIARACFLAQSTGASDLERKANRYFDVVLIQKTLAFLVTDGIAIFLQTFIGLFLISLYHPFFIIFGFVILIAIVSPIYVLLARARESAVGESTAKYEVANYIEDIARPQNGGEIPLEEKIAKADQMIFKYLNKRSHHFKLLFTQNILYMIVFATLNACLLALGGYLVISNQLTVGQLVAAEIVVNSILSQCLYAKKYLDSYYDMYASARKIQLFYEFIDETSESENPSAETKKILDFTQKTYHEHFSSIRSVYRPSNYRKILGKFAVGFIILVLALSLTPWLQTSRGYGKVTAFSPNDRAQTITANVNGIIENWLIQDGQEVKAGDPIVQIVDNDPQYLVRLETGRDAAVKKFEAAKEASDVGRLNYHRQEKLVAEGLSSRKEFEKSNITYKKLLSEEASAAAALAKAEVALSRQQMQQISAPRDGKILRILHGSGSVLVKKGDPLVRFVPKTDENAVELFVDGNDLPLITPGRHVRLQFEGWPSVQFSGWPSVAIGSFGGLVKVVDPSVSEDGRFRILVTPDPADMDWPDETYLRQGARTVGLVLLDQVSIGYEFWRQINGFPKSMPKPPEEFGKKKPKKRKK
ncbi:MAG: HlyD family efflux transporter periplasmic adaptor subunit [Pseudomonadota bacterium]